MEIRRILNEPTAAALAFGVLQSLVQPNFQCAVAADGGSGVGEGGTDGQAEKDHSIGVDDAKGPGEDPAGLSLLSEVEALGAGAEGPTMLVFDFGGGTLDVTVMQAARGGAFKVGILPFARC
mgnify:CR=1 FL=1